MSLLHKKIISSLILLLLIPGCISNIFKEPRPTFSNEVILPEFQSQYTILTDNVYPAWKNTTTGNVISIVSDCNEGSFNLKSIHNLMSDSIDSVKVIEEKATNINHKSSYFKKIKGDIDGRAIEIQSYSFQNKKCTYVAAISGKPDKISQNMSDFKNFVDKLDFKK